MTYKTNITKTKVISHMAPLRFEREVDYYDLVLEKYEKLEEGDISEERIKITSHELLSIMEELKVSESVSQEEKEMMEHITQNIIILLLSLFEEKDETIRYKDYSELDSQEKTLLKQTLKANY